MEGGTARIPLRDRQGGIRAYVRVDAEDHEALSRHRWSLHQRGYACRWVPGRYGNGATSFMHRELLGLEPGDGLQGDHINRDRLDNRKANLRVVTIQQQRQNQEPRGKASRYRGVCFNRQRGAWYARVRLDGKTYYLGQHATEEEAAEAASRFRAEHMDFAVERSAA